MCTSTLECIGCGYCCFEMPCSISMSLYGPVRSCPALYWNGLRYMCMVHELRTQLGVTNEFCCQPLNPCRQSGIIEMNGVVACW